MKRMFAIVLSAALLLSLCACGEGAASSAGSASGSQSVLPVQSAKENTDGYVVPSVWTETSINDGTWGYVTAASELPSANYQGGDLIRQDYDEETQHTTLTRYTLEGQEVSSTDIPPLEAANADAVETYCYVSDPCFAENGIWLVHSQISLLDQETGESESIYYLEQWSYEGTCLQSLPMADLLKEDDTAEFFYSLALDNQENPIFTTEKYVYFCDGSGRPTDVMDSGGIGYHFCRDAAGRLYLYAFFDDSQVYTIDWDNHALGSALFTAEMNEQILPGGGEYDFFLKNETTLRGVSLSSGTITEILSWADLDLTNSVGNILYLDADTFLISAYSSLLEGGVQVLTLSRVPAAEIPERAVVRLAVPLNAEWEGQTWVDSLDHHVAEVLNQYNRSSTTHRVEVETYSSGQELQLKLAAGDAPDLIYWNYTTTWLEEPPSMELYAKKGYLQDLEPLFDADEELSTGDFIPNLLELVRARTDGLYAMPIDFYAVTLTAPKEYVGGQTGWTFSDLLSAAKRMPEDMILMDSPPSSCLEDFLNNSIDCFVDVNAGTCNFENQEFYDLLTLCRDYCPPESAFGAEYTPAPGGTLLGGAGCIAGTSDFAAVLKEQEAQGRTPIGYPGAKGNGTVLIFSQEMSICALGQQQEAAWDFMRTLYAYDFQRNGTSIMCAVRQDAFDDKEAYRLAQSEGDCTQDQVMAARELIYGAASIRNYDSPALSIIKEEAAAFFAGDKSAETVAEIIQNRVEIYLGEQS